MKDHIERTELAQMAYYGLVDDRQVVDVAGRDPSPHEIRMRVLNNLIQQIENDPEYPKYPPHDQEDYVLGRLYRMDEQNGLPYNVDPHDLFTTWITKRRPDTTVIHLGQHISKPFYE